MSLTVAVSAQASGCSLESRARIVFARGYTGHIFTVCPDGEGSRQITHGGASDQEPAWSADHRWIAFVRQSQTGPLHIYVMRPDGTGIRQVTTGGTDDFMPAWSPDGRPLIFTRGNGATNLKVFTARRDGSHLRYVTVGSGPAWSPDGTRIAVTRCSHSTGNCGIYSVRPNGTSARRITPRSVSAADADWSPDGAHIAFELIVSKPGTSPSKTNTEIAVIRPHGNDLRRVTTHSTGTDSIPSWSPDGHQIAFQRSSYDSRSVALETIRVPTAPGRAVVTGQHPQPVGSVAGWDPDW